MGKQQLSINPDLRIVFRYEVVATNAVITYKHLVRIKVYHSWKHRNWLVMPCAVLGHDLL